MTSSEPLNGQPEKKRGGSPTYPLPFGGASCGLRRGLPSTAAPERCCNFWRGEGTCWLGRLNRTDAASRGYDLAGGGRCPLSCLNSRAAFFPLRIRAFLARQRIRRLAVLR